MASSISASPLSKVAENTKAASPYVNIGCQCSPLLCQDVLLQFQLLPRLHWLPSPHLSLIHTQLLHTLSKVELSPLEQVMVDSMATLVLLILVLSSHTVNIFQSLPTVHQEAAVTLSNFKI